MFTGLNRDYFSDWLEVDNYAAKYTEHPVYFLSRQDQRVRRVKHHLENYVFVTDNSTDFTSAQLKTGEVVSLFPLSVMRAFNTGDGLAAQD